MYYEHEDLLFFVEVLKAQSSLEMQLRVEKVL